MLQVVYTETVTASAATSEKWSTVAHPHTKSAINYISKHKKKFFF